MIVPKRDAARAGGADGPADRRARRIARACRRDARVTGQQYDIAAFVRKMERLYDLLHRVSRADAAAGGARSGPVVPDEQGLGMTPDRRPAVARRRVQRRA